MRFKKGVCLVSRVCPGSPRANCPGPPVSFYRYCIGRLRARRAVVRACGCGSEVVRDGCEVRLCDPCVRVSGSPPVSFYRYCIVPVPILQIPLIPVLRCQTRRSRSQKAYESRTPHRARVVRKPKHKYTITTCIWYSNIIINSPAHPGTHTRQSVSQSVSYFTVPPRAQPSAGSPSGSAAPGLTQVPSAGRTRNPGIASHVKSFSPSVQGGP